MRLYPYIDIAVLPELRESFGRGEALAVISADATEVVWVNGPGAAFFGAGSVEDLIGEALPLGAQARRQICAAAGGRTPRPLLLRMDRGIGQRQVPVKAGRLVLPDGEGAILLIGPEAGEAQAVTGFSDEKAVAALLDGSGRRLAADDRLAAIDPSPEDLLMMRNRLEKEGAASVKQRIHTAQGLVPAALGDLGGDPQRFILFMFLEPAVDEPPVAAGKAASEDESETRPLRFSWETDEDDRFTNISEAFKAIVGTTAAIEGRYFADVVGRLALDPEGRLVALVKRQETWSGRSVNWPIAGTETMVPVDLAALPLYDRYRRFVGYRGYGVAHCTDIAPDEQARGLVFADGWPHSQADDREDSAVPHAASEEKAVADFLMEPPALTPSPLRRRSDRSDERERRRKRLTDAETLAFRSIGERLLEENGGGDIGDDEREALKEVERAATAVSDEAEAEAERAAPTVYDSSSDEPAVETEAELVDAEADPAPAEAPVENDDEAARLAIESIGWRRTRALAPAVAARLREDQVAARNEDAGNQVPGGTGDEPQPAEVGEEEAADRPAATTEDGEPESFAGPAPAMTQAQAAAAEANPAETDRAGPEPAEAEDENDSGADIDAMGLPDSAEGDDADLALTETRRSTQLTPSVLARLPVAALVYDHGRIAYASRSLLDMTGHRDVASLEAAGGFASLFGEQDAGAGANRRPTADAGRACRWPRHRRRRPDAGRRLEWRQRSAVRLHAAAGGRAA